MFLWLLNADSLVTPAVPWDEVYIPHKWPRYCNSSRTRRFVVSSAKCPEHRAATRRQASTSGDVEEATTLHQDHLRTNRRSAAKALQNDPQQATNVSIKMVWGSDNEIKVYCTGKHASEALCKVFRIQNYFFQASFLFKYS